MKHTREFNFKLSRPVTRGEVESARKGIERKLGIKRMSRGRPPKSASEKYRPIQIRLHPKALQWAISEAHRRRIGYQTVINEILLQSSHSFK